MGLRVRYLNFKKKFKKIKQHKILIFRFLTNNTFVSHGSKGV